MSLTETELIEALRLVLYEQPPSYPNPCLASHLDFQSLQLERIAKCLERLVEIKERDISNVEV